MPLVARSELRASVPGLSTSRQLTAAIVGFATNASALTVDVAASASLNKPDFVPIGLAGCVCVVRCWR